MPRPSTPNMVNAPRPAGLNSPPQTPKSASPAMNQPGSHTQANMPQQQRASHHNHRHTHNRRSGLQPGIHPLGNGTNFSYRPQSLRPDQLSPRSSSSSSAEDSDSDSSTSDSPPRSLSSQHSRKSTAQQPAHRPVERQQTRSPSPVARLRAARMVIVESTIVVEELFGPFENLEGIKVLRPSLIEYADSDRSRSRSRNPPAELDRKMVSDLQDLTFPATDDDEEEEESDLDEDQYEKLLLKQRAEARWKRMSSGSIGKRTISERGSDSDGEDLVHGLPHDAAEAGQQTRRMRRRFGGNRVSLQFQDPPPPRIDECDEPDSSEEILDEAGLLLARELPFYDYISMEVDSP